VIVYLIAVFSYKYFKNDPLKAQMVCFILMANEEVRELNQLLFNDSILELYIIFCIYFVTINRPLWASLMLSLGISIKAGAILLLPGFLGWTQYQYGTLTLLSACTLIISF
jgi:Gpi18-like mannosyltransferase